MKKIAILQSCYLPWKGYFDIINSVDEFILYDEVQFTKNDWRNRNLIKSSKGVEWLTIPVHGSISKPIQDIQVTNDYWYYKHWKTLKNIYAKAKYFDLYKYHFEQFYNECGNIKNLSLINYKFITKICEFLNIKTKISWSKDYEKKFSHDNKSIRLVELCKQANAHVYISGPSAKNYIDEKLFLNNAIQIHYMNYSSYPPYDQLFGEFIHNVSIVDLLFNTGHSANLFMMSFNR